MCGIAGILTDGEPVTTSMIQSMCETIIHRGPDDEGCFVSGRVGLGMRRLSIIDLEGGQQPFFNEDRTIAVVQNGEIYNFTDLQRELTQRGHCFTSNCDTEVIVHAYEEYGLDFVHKLNGMFAIAIWDALQQQLVLARDRIGQKPLYYCQDGTLWFGSEIKAIRQGREIRDEWDYQALYDYLVFGYVPAPRSIFKSIRKLAPGNLLVSSREGVRVMPYWNPAPHSMYAGDREDAIIELESLVDDAVRIRLMSDVPLGAFLSGGLDSSIVVAKMAEHSSTAVKTFFIDFSEEGYSERQYARAVASCFSTDHHELVVKPQALEVMDQVVGHFDEPFGDASAIPTYYVSKAAREHVTVALAGDGGDESFGGYRSYRRAMARRELGPFRKSVGPACRAAYALMPSRTKGRRAVRAFCMSNFDVFRGRMNEIEVREICTPQLLGKVNCSPFFDVPSPESSSLPTDPLSRYSQFDLAYYLPDDVLTKVDRMSMLNSLEVRGPFLDYRVVEFAARLPAHWKIEGRNTKVILKDAFKERLPSSILGQRKQGFSIPLAAWLRTSLRDVLEATIEDDVFSDDGLFRRAEIRKRAQEHCAGVRDWTSFLWRLIVLVRWNALN